MPPAVTAAGEVDILGMTLKLKKGDTVKIISGNDRGESGTIRTVLGRERRIIVEGINMKKKHVRPRKAGQKGEVAHVPMPFEMSRAMLVCPGCAKSVRPLMRMDAGKKQSTCRACGRVR